MFGQSFFKISDDIWAIYIGANRSEASSCRINLYSERYNKVIYGLLPINDIEYNWMYFKDINNFTYLNDDVVLLNYTCNDTLYSVRDGKIEPFLMFDWGENSLPASFLEKDYENIMEFNQKLSNKYIISVIGIFGNNYNLSFGFRYNQKLHLAILSKDSNQPKIISDVINPYGLDNCECPVDISLLAMASDSLFFYSIIDSYFIQNTFKNIEEKSHPLFNFKIDDNPIIMRYKYR